MRARRPMFVVSTSQQLKVHSELHPLQAEAHM